MESFNMPPVEKQQEESPEKQFSKEELTSFLKKNAINLSDELRYLKDFAQNSGAVPPFTWNENSGVIVFNDGEKVYVVKSSEEITNKLFKYNHFYEKKENIGVPHINDEGIWNSKSDFDYFMKRFNQQ